MASQSRTDLYVGTVKGLFHFRSDDRRAWRREGFHFPEVPIYGVGFDAMTGTLYASLNNIFFGLEIRRSTDLGWTWSATASTPSYGADDDEKVTRVWSFAPAPDEGEGVVYAGVEASGLFRSADRGDSWAEVAALRRHPTHDTWGPGFGGKCLHTIALDQHRPGRMYIAVSAGGIYRTEDRGASWQPINRGIRCDFNPEPMRYPESGQCVHRFALSPTRPDRIFLQNHGGVYRSDDGGDSWVDIGKNLPQDFGFAVVAHPHRADTAFTVPLQADEGRWFLGNQMGLYRTDDAGESWRPLRNGLPGEVWSGVLRGALTHDEEPRVGLYFGTTTGEVYASADEGESWNAVAGHLPRVLAVAAVTRER
jgi:photosystem II stability/assembly factor-like uncharacterized protein